MSDIDRIIATCRKDSRCVSGIERRMLCDEIERLTALLTPCRSDTDIEDVGYPRTTNDVLSLLSAYIVDVMPESIPGDEYFGAWERLARPVIERLTSSSDERDSEIERLRLKCVELGAQVVRQADEIDLLQSNSNRKVR